MDLLYRVPESLKPYLESIPEESICRMITIALERAVSDRSIMGRSSAQDEGYAKLLGKISEMLENRPAVPLLPKEVHKPKPLIPKPTLEVEEIAATSSDDDERSFEDLADDFLSLAMR